jgi:hypothetical protein
MNEAGVPHFLTHFFVPGRIVVTKDTTPGGKLCVFGDLVVVWISIRGFGLVVP